MAVKCSSCCKATDGHSKTEAARSLPCQTCGHATLGSGLDPNPEVLPAKRKETRCPPTGTSDGGISSSSCWAALFPTLAVGLLDFKVDVVLARLEADFSDQPPSISAVPNHQVSLQCPTAEYPCSAQPMSIPALPNRRVSLHCPTAKVSPQCSTTKYPRSAQPQSIPAVSNCKVSLQCPTAEYPGSVQPPNIPAGPNRKVSLQCPTAEYPWSAQRQSINILATQLQCCKEDS